MDLRIDQPHILLRKYISSYSYLDYQGGESERGSTLRFPSDGGAEIIFNLGDVLYGGSSLDAVDAYAGARFIGPHSRSFFIKAKGHTQFISVKLYPGRFRFFLGFPANEILNKSIPLSHIWGSQATQLFQKLISSSSFEEMALWMDRAFLTLVLNQSLKRQELDELVDIIYQSNDQVVVKNLAKHIHLSNRQMERKFQEIVGFTAKRFCRIRRFNEMLGSLNLYDVNDWADIANNNRFADQPHLIRECTYFTGLSPKKYWSGLPIIHKRLISLHAKPPILPFSSEDALIAALQM
ncbi:MAG: AraC family transcriptional regulator [Deltaproteobacteria bacterium]|nr:AraC family transcriptional regulator [Deltaproteobacteria bacterium]